MADRLLTRAAREPGDQLGSVGNALRLLTMLRTRPAIRVSDAAAELGVARSTAHRLLATLVFHEVFEQDPTTRAYHAGPLLIELGLMALRHDDLVTAMHPILLELRDLVDETVHLGILEGTNCHFVDSVESRQDLRVTGRIGIVFPAHTLAAGKALLAELDDERLRELYPKAELPTVTDRTIATRDELFTELARVREQGYATNRGESQVGLAAVAVAVRSSRGAARATLAVTTPESRLPEARVPEVAEACLRIAADAGRRVS